MCKYSDPIVNSGDLDVSSEISDSNIDEFADSSYTDVVLQLILYQVLNYYFQN